MNVALPALIVFLVLLPGFIFRARLKRAERTSLDFSPFGQVAAEAVLWALVVHLAWLSIAFLCCERRFEPLVLLKLLSSAPASQIEAAVAVGEHFRWIATYFCTLLFASYAVPAALRSAISRYRLDRGSSPFGPLFRFHDAPWYYLLTGADFARNDAPDLIVVSAIVEVGKGAVLYVGVLDEFRVDPDGQLDRVVLQGVARRPIENDKPGPEAGVTPADRFYPVDGDSFVLRYSEMVTLNIQYVKLTEQGSS